VFGYEQLRADWRAAGDFEGWELVEGSLDGEGA